MVATSSSRESHVCALLTGLRVPLLKALAEASNHQPHVYVPCKPIVVLLAEAREYRPPILAFREMLKGDTPLVATGTERTLWGLTEAGLALVSEMTAEEPCEAPTGEQAGSEPNATSLWLTEHLRPLPGETESRLYRKMRSRLARHLPVSAGRQMLDDHIQEFLCRVIRRDSFAKHIEGGKSLPYSKVVSWCANSGRTDARNMGTDALTRTMYGALTEKERREMAERGDDEKVRIEDAPKMQDTDGNFIADDAVVTMDGFDFDHDFEAVWGRVERAVSRRVEKAAAARYVNILSMKLRDMSSAEIAKAEGVSDYRAAALVAKARRCVREGREAGEFEDYLY